MLPITCLYVVMFYYYQKQPLERCAYFGILQAIFILELLLHNTLCVNLHQIIQTIRTIGWLHEVAIDLKDGNQKFAESTL